MPLALTLALATIPLTGHGEDLLDVYREAYANDPVLSQADIKRLSASEDVQQSRSLLLPQAKGVISLKQARDRNTDLNNSAPLLSDLARSRNASINTIQQVNHLARWAELSASMSEADSQNATYRAAIQELYVRTAAAYFDVLIATDQLSFVIANEEALRQAYEQADEHFKAGLSAITPMYLAKSAYEQAKANTIQTTAKLSNTKEVLRQLTGKPAGNLKKLREDIPMIPPSPAIPGVWVQLASTNNPALAAQRHKVQSAVRSIYSAKAAHLPTLNASVAHSKSDVWAAHRNNADVTPATNRRESGEIAVSLDIPIYSGGATQSKVRQSTYHSDGARAALESQRRRVTRDVLSLYRAAVTGIAQMEAAKAGVDSGRQALDAIRAGFTVGTQTMLNVLTAIQTLMQARSLYSQSRHQFLLNKLRLKQQAGTIDMKDMEEINALLQ